MKNLTIIAQAAELYSVGLEVENERQKLTYYANKYGYSAPEIEKQLKKYDKVEKKFNELEKKHIAAMEKYAGINSSSNNGN